jgi:MarR family transcriptional regulator, organic hydroperoxide resistance regulator
VEIEEFFNTQNQIGVLMQHVMEALLYEKGVTPLQFMTLKMLKEQGKKCKMSELAEMRYLTPAAATGIVNKLVHLGMVERSFDEHDRRLVLLTLTERGNQMVSGMDATMQELMLRFFKGISESDRSATLRIGRKLLEFLRTEVDSLKRK